MLRGINRQRIFEEVGDYQRFLELVLEAKEYADCSLLAYCLMDNHIHLLLAEGDKGVEERGDKQRALSRFFSHLATRYAQWFNKKYQRSGHLFQNRYRSEAVQDDAYLLTVISYIHQNPVKAGLCDKPQDYRWSSRHHLGSSGTLVDEERLSEYVCIDDIMANDATDAESVMDQERRGRRPRFSESVAAALISEMSGTRTTTEFLALPPDAQRQTVQSLRVYRMPIRQIARMTGLGKGIVERWSGE
jgi:REP element-mobilizing transposase RayT